jgi:hypothetical protein
VLVVAACGGSDGTNSEAPEEPGDAMLALIDSYRKGQFGRAWDMLLPEHQEVVSRSKFDECRSQSAEGDIPNEANFRVEEVYDESIEIPGLGSTQTKAVTVNIEYESQSVSETAHLVERGGEWKWILTPSDYESYSAGECPL